MKVVIDNNVIIDAAARRAPHNEEAEKIVTLAGDRQFEGYITANSATDIYYVMKKAVGVSAAKELLTHLFNLFGIAPVSGDDCGEALILPIADFEDALLTICAKKINADYLISRDEDFQKVSSPVPVISPSDFLAKCV